MGDWGGGRGERRKRGRRNLACICAPVIKLNELRRAPDFELGNESTIIEHETAFDF